VLTFFSFGEWKKHAHGKCEKIWQKIVNETKFRIIGINNFKGVKGPLGGFEAFLHSLEKKINECQIPIIKGEVEVIEELSNGVEVTLSDGRLFLVAEVLMGDSSNVNMINGYKLSQLRERCSYHYIISVKTTHVCMQSPYTHFVGHTDLRRITHLKNLLINEEYVSLFLLETNKKLDDTRSFVGQLSEISLMHNIINNFSTVEMVKFFETKYLSPRERNIKCGERIRHVSTLGNFSLACIKNFGRKNKCLNNDI